MRIRLNLAYDGAAYRGWQVQPDARTVQGVLEGALARFYDVPEVRVIAAGRTDTGVHAVGQVAHFDAPSSRDLADLVRAMGALLPEDVRVWRARGVEADFHARYNARERVYAYRILDRPDLFRRGVAWWPHIPFDPDRAAELAGRLTGRRDWRAFSTRPDPDEETVCDLRRVEWRQAADGGWVVHFVADRFLRRMVRTLVGTLIDAAAGRLGEDELEELLASGRGRAGVPAPPQGLALLRVRYDNDEPEDRPQPSPWGESP